jgi:ribosomal protein L40E
VCGYSDGKPIIDVIHLLNTYIIKLKCPKCKTLNSKEVLFCRECNYNFYRDEKEYRSSLELIEKLERKINSKGGMRKNSTQI